MGSRGPQPKPTAIKKLLGNPGRRVLNDNEPIPPPGEIRAPASLRPEAKPYWDHLAPLLTAMKVLTTADVYVLCRLCNLHAMYKELTDFLMSKGANGGVYMVKDGNGRVRGVAELPQAWEWRQIHGMICSHERELGLTPAARTRLRVEPSSLPAAGMMDMPSVVGPSGMKIQDFFSGGGPKPGGPPKSQTRA